MKYITPILLIIIFLSSIPEMFNKIIFSDIRQKISETTDIDAIAEFKTQMLYMTGSRILLVCLFIGIAFLVFKANNKRKLKTQTI